MHLNPQEHQLTAIVLAGDRTKADSLINHSNAGSKAMIDIDGLPMVRRVLNALRLSRVVSKITLSGPEASEVAKDEQLAQWVADGEVIWSEPGVSPSTSAYQAMNGLDPEEAVLLTTADHPLLTAEIVDAFGRQSLADDVDVVVGLAPHALVLEAYPGIKKTVLHFSDGEFCGCNLFAFITPEGRRAARFWRRIEQQRKKPQGFCLENEVHQRCKNAIHWFGPFRRIRAEVEHVHQQNTEQRKSTHGIRRFQAGTRIDGRHGFTGWHDGHSAT